MESIDEYLATQPDDVRTRLERVRALVHEVAPEAGEKIAYKMPTFTLAGVSKIHLAGWKAHISIYPEPEELAAELAPYSSGRGTLKFLHREPLPEEILRRVIAALMSR